MARSSWVVRLLVSALVLLVTSCNDSRPPQRVSQSDGSNSDGPSISCESGSTSSPSSLGPPTSDTNSLGNTGSAGSSSRRVRGRVIDHDGCPISGADVRFTIFSTGTYARGVTDTHGSYDAECPDSGSFYLVVSGQPFDDTRQPGAPELNYEPSIVGTTDPASTSLPILCGPQDLPPIVTTLHPGGIVEGHVYTTTGEIAPYAHVQIQGVPLPCPCQGSF
ncbi:MAG: Carboxypeptidase regulatory-like domain, partial [Acidimicrobiaceae bacterium]